LEVTWSPELFTNCGWEDLNLSKRRERLSILIPSICISIIWIRWKRWCPYITDKSVPNRKKIKTYWVLLFVPGRIELSQSRLTCFIKVRFTRPYLLLPSASGVVEVSRNGLATL